MLRLTIPLKRALNVLPRTERTQACRYSTLNAFWCHGQAGLAAIQHPRACLIKEGRRTFSTRSNVESSGTSTAEQGHNTTRTVSTLDPSKLTPNDYQDFSGLCQPNIRIATATRGKCERLQLVYDKDQYRYYPFPPSARGFLYFHRPPGTPALTSQIRFRLVPEPDPALFDEGKDLVTSDGIPWGVLLPAVLVRTTFHRLAELVLREGHISPEEEAEIRSIVGDRTAIDTGTELLWNITDPFYLHFRRKYCWMRVRHRGKIETIGFRTKQTMSSGTALVRFEVVWREAPVTVLKAKGPPPPPSPRVAIRILKFTAPPEGADVGKQREGELLCVVDETGTATTAVSLRQPTFPEACWEELLERYPLHPSRVYPCIPRGYVGRWPVGVE
ncbi:hypothetical protein CC1G_06228 [Coprinopsis cinerea okayama7|uniref:Uncharacterized protein n=1 Tax=Coprinopsis cinerea (strain Okayama-7 / 130 / ATCC MYA-4618 / FGSC 9003) TaxID=240176 RepID=A8NVA8_COPC7|nr:hypothetical protein CC1G_06228 [Coprinopsis cinerea okayama7\|eukprot:XP_001836641.2 hypothetical protein CC1G_06228 [Coprinopsis cinerea okayama7\